MLLLHLLLIFGALPAKWGKIKFLPFLLQGVEIGGGDFLFVFIILVSVQIGYLTDE